MTLHELFHCLSQDLRLPLHHLDELTADSARALEAVGQFTLGVAIDRVQNCLLRALDKEAEKHGEHSQA